MPPFIEGESAPFMVWNRNKRSVALDLKSAEGKAKLLELVDGADILIENMRPGVMGKLGLGYATLSKRNPRLIYAAISGFGQTGPYASRGGFDLIAQSAAGEHGIQRNPENAVKVGPRPCDLASGPIDAKYVLRRHTALLAIIIAELQ